MIATDEKVSCGEAEVWSAFDASFAIWSNEADWSDSGKNPPSLVQPSSPYAEQSEGIEVDPRKRNMRGRQSHMRTRSSSMKDGVKRKKDRKTISRKLSSQSEPDRNIRVKEAAIPRNHSLRSDPGRSTEKHGSCSSKSIGSQRSRDKRRHNPRGSSSSNRGKGKRANPKHSFPDESELSSETESSQSRSVRSRPRSASMAPRRSRRRSRRRSSHHSSSRTPSCRVSRSRSTSRTPSRRNQGTLIDLSPSLACSRAKEKVRRKSSWREQRETKYNSGSDSEYSADEQRRQSILDVSRRGPVRALSIGRQSLDADVANCITSDDSGTESEGSLLLENSSHTALHVVGNNAQDPGLHGSMPKVDNRTPRRLSSDPSLVSMPEYYGYGRAAPDSAKKSVAGYNAPKEGPLTKAGEGDCMVDEILKSRRLRRASASHRRGSASHADKVSRRSTGTSESILSKNRTTARIKGLLGNFGQ